MTNDLPTRLLAAIEERAKSAQAAMDGIWKRWESPQGKYRFGVNTVRVGIDVYAPVDEHAEAVSRYLEGQSPDAVLRLCQAHREIVELCRAVIADTSAPAAVLARLTLRTLASAYNLEESP